MFIQRRRWWVVLQWDLVIFYMKMKLPCIKDKSRIRVSLPGFMLEIGWQRV